MGAIRPGPRFGFVRRSFGVWQRDRGARRAAVTLQDRDKMARQPRMCARKCATRIRGLWLADRTSAPEVRRAGRAVQQAMAKTCRLVLSWANGVRDREVGRALLIGCPATGHARLRVRRRPRGLAVAIAGVEFARTDDPAHPPIPASTATGIKARDDAFIKNCVACILRGDLRGRNKRDPRYDESCDLASIHIQSLPREMTLMVSGKLRDRDSRVKSLIYAISFRLRDAGVRGAGSSWRSLPAVHTKL